MKECCAAHSRHNTTDFLFNSALYIESYFAANVSPK